MSHFNVEPFAATPEFFLFFLYFSHDLSWHSYGYNSIRRLLMAFYQTHLSDNGPPPNDAVIAYRGSHADNGIVFDLGIVDHGTVSDRHVVSEHSPVIGACMYDYALFNSRSFSHMDRP